MKVTLEITRTVPLIQILFNFRILLIGKLLICNKGNIDVIVLCDLPLSDLQQYHTSL